MTTQRNVVALKVVLWLAALAPGAWLVAGIFLGRLGANPIERLTLVTGLTAFVLLLVTLAVTPVRRITGWNALIRLRRPLGLFAFFYALGHFSIWFVFDMVFNVSWMLDDIAERPFITVGMTALVMLLPLALTSTRGWIRRLGRKWATLHRGVYVAAGLALVHFYWGQKADTRLPIILGAVLLALLAVRIPAVADRVAARRRAGSTGRATEPRAGEREASEPSLSGSSAP